MYTQVILGTVVKLNYSASVARRQFPIFFILERAEYQRLVYLLYDSMLRSSYDVNNETFCRIIVLQLQQ